MDVGDGVTIGNSDVVEGSIISAWSPITWCTFRYHMERGRPITGGGTDDTQLEHVVKLLASDFEAVRGESTSARTNWWGVCSNGVGNGMFDRLIH